MAVEVPETTTMSVRTVTARRRGAPGRHRALLGLRPLTAAGRRVAVASALALALAVGGQTPAFADSVPSPLTAACVTAPAVPPAVVATTGSAADVYGGVLLTGRQIDAAATIVNVGLDAGVSRRGIAVAIAAALQASSLNAAARNGAHLGLFQQRSDASSGLYTAKDRRDAVGSAQMFFGQLTARVPGYDADPRSDADLADAVQESGDVASLAAWSAVAAGLVDHFVPVEAPLEAAVAAPTATPAVVAAPVRESAATGGPALGNHGEPVAFALRGPGFVLAAPTGTAAATDPTSTSAPAPAATDSGDAPTDHSTMAGTTTSDGPSSTGVTTTSDGATAPTTAPVTTGTDDADAAGTTEPTATDPTSTDPTSTDPTSTDPSSTDATTTEPTTTAPATDPTTTDAVPTDPTTTEPTTEPAPTDPTTTEPTTEPTNTGTPVVDPPVVDTPQVPETDPVPVRSSDTVGRATNPITTGPCGPDNNGGSTVFDPGFIISDEVFYNSQAMTAEQIQAFMDAQGAACEGASCIRNLRVTTPDMPADAYCADYTGGTDELASAVLARASVACGINPQVMLVTLQKESALVTKSSVTASSYAAAWGWHCPDSGPGGSANCDPAHAGFFNQLFGMAKQWSRYRVDPAKYHFQAGQTTEVLWNVAESGCGGSAVTIRNTATASLYNYTPYQPNAAALASYPGVGDRCSAYGNRNFFALFGKYFGVTGGGLSANISVNGVQVTIPDLPTVAPEVRGAVVTAPNENVARGLAAGFAAIGLPYVWGGGTNGGQADQGCSRGGTAKNSCSGTVGFDCSGLTAYVLTSAGYAVGTNSGSQRAGGRSVPWSAGQVGDIIGYSGHVAVYLGTINGVEYLLEAPNVGKYVQIRAVYGRTSGSSADAMLHRYWG